MKPKIKFESVGSVENPTKFYLQKVEIIESESDNYEEVEDSGGYDVPNGTYIQKCTCHPEANRTRVIIVEDGHGYVSEEVEID